MSIYATFAAKTYRVKVALSDYTERVVEYRICAHHPCGHNNRFDVIEIEGIDRDGSPTTVIVPEWVLRHFINMLDHEPEYYSLAEEILGKKEAVRFYKKIIRRRRQDDNH